MQKKQGLRIWGKKSIHSKKTSIFVCRAVKARLDCQGFAMKTVHLRKIKLFGLKRRIVLLRNDADAAAFMAGLQMRDGARMTRHRQSVEWGLRTFQQRISSKKQRKYRPPGILPHLGMKGG